MDETDKLVVSALLANGASASWTVIADALDLGEGTVAGGAVDCWTPGSSRSPPWNPYRAWGGWPLILVF
ncbi:AsnC family protein [Streptomyces sp. WM6378]|uniref:AsnC family protein n=1 Tax=Streptomyces sp. WM6378 TaxID=1415557 RepID=UPI0006AEC348|nr:AsnC family protein [Streptomyces sp. WM6378]KOU53104.1 hypothetical protein ADK54_05645 [Streptomyces sp. WM6378]